MVPALAAGGTVGVSTAVLAKRFGLVAGACAGIFIATNPLFVESSRDVRGYSLAALLAVLATISLSPQGGGLGRGARVLYPALLGLPIATPASPIVVLLPLFSWL